MTGSSTRHRAFCLAVLLLVCPSLHACNTQKTKWQLGIPGVHTPFVVASLKQRGDFLDVVLQGSGFALESYTPDDETCRQVLQPEKQVEWIASGSRGAFRRNDVTCQSAGIGSLHEWRSRAPRPQTLQSAPVPRAQANYRVVHRDADVAFLRGSFPLANRLGWVGGSDSIAVVPNSEICQGPIGRATSSMQYYPKGKQVLALVASNGMCPIVGLIRP